MSALLSPDFPPPAPAAARPASVSPASTSMATPVTHQSRSQQKRATHTIGGAPQHPSGHRDHHHRDPRDDQPAYHDVYSHQAAVAYASAHPRRTIPKFGPYLLLQTLGEGEFGKVKLGLHSQWGEEVAVKLIRRGNVDSEVRMSKVEREIEVLRNLKHPNIVRLYDVIETDKYIGIILEYASGGELFDHILAHRYLRERDAAKLFSQLISGVWYIHQKKIVHRDLKLENLLLDKNRNVIITDFGFANRFEHKADDLMQTSCGSPCYAAPELVISEGLYVGSAVDIWSCGVILYAMLAGYLPFDDDPANPDGDNINLLYKYIVNTPLSFPEYVSDQARDILSMMLVPDPKRRSDLAGIMRHPWLAAHAGDMPIADQQGVSTAFGRTVEDLEKAAMEQHQLKRLAYQKQMRTAAVQAREQQQSTTQQRSQSHRGDMYATAPPVGRTRSDQPQYLYESPSAADTSSVSMAAAPANRKGHASLAVTSSGGYAAMDIDPFAGPSTSKRSRGEREQSASGPTDDDGEKRAKRDDGDDVASIPKKDEAKKATGGFRHTIQVEYDEPGQDFASHGAAAVKKEDIILPPVLPAHLPASPSPNGSIARREREAKASSPPGSYVPVREKKDRQPSAASVVRPQTPPSSSPTAALARSSTTPSRSATTPTVSISAASPPATPTASIHQATSSDEQPKETKHKKRGSSISGIGKIFGVTTSEPKENGTTPSSRVPSESSQKSYNAATSSSPAASKSSLNPSTTTHNTEKESTVSVASAASNATKDEEKNKRRTTLTVMVGAPISAIKNRTKSRMSTTPEATLSNRQHQEKPPLSALHTTSTKQPLPAPPQADEMGVVGAAMGNPASTNKARNVMAWFRRKKTADSLDVAESTLDAAAPPPPPPPPAAARQLPVLIAETRQRKPSTALPADVLVRNTPVTTPTSTTIFGRLRGSVTVGNNTAGTSQAPSSSGSNSEVKVALPRIHHGPLDKTMVTTQPPAVTMPLVKDVLKGMGLEVQMETDFKFRCVRTKRRKVGLGSSDVGQGVAAFNIAGSAASNGVDKRGLPVPSAFHGGSNMLKGLLMRRQSSQVSSGVGAGASQPSLSLEDDLLSSPASASPGNNPLRSPSSTAAVDASVVVAEPGTMIPEPLYGSTSQDMGDEVRFSVELTRLDRLKDTYSLDIRRLKGNLRSYQFLYDTVRTRTEIQQQGKI